MADGHHQSEANSADERDDDQREPEVLSFRPGC